MKETGIVMTGNHPTKILDDLKTMTRRTWGLDYINRAPDLWICTGFSEGNAYFDIKIGCEEESDRVYGICKNLQRIKCPYGQVGDRLWVRETCYYKEMPIDKGANARLIIYKADIKPDSNILPPLWKPSIHMPKWASRIWLEITEVRVERLQEITEYDVEREGVSLPNTELFPWLNREDKLKKHFAILWDSLNAKRGYGWEVNPWVWPIGFKRQ